MVKKVKVVDRTLFNLFNQFNSFNQLSQLLKR